MEWKQKSAEKRAVENNNSATQKSQIFLNKLRTHDILPIVEVIDLRIKIVVLKLSRNNLTKKIT